MAAVSLAYDIIARDKGFSSTMRSTSRSARTAFSDIDRASGTASSRIGTHWWNRLGRKGTGSVTGAVTAASTGMHALKTVALGAGVALGGMAFAKIAGEGMGMASAMTSAKMSFETMTGSAEKAQVMLDKMKDFAAKTPFEFPELVQASQRLMAMGFEAEKVIPIMTSVGDAVGTMGGSAEMVQRVVIALGQMRAKGKVSAEEMMQITETGIPAWEMLATTIGVSVPDAMELARKGQLDVDETITAIVDGMGEKYAGGMEKQSKTINGLMSTLKDNISFALAAIVEPFMPFMKKTVEALISFTERAGPIVTSVMERAAPHIERVFGSIQEAGRTIVPKLKDAFDRLAPKLQEFFKWGQDTVKSWLPHLRTLWDNVRKSFEDARPGLENIVAGFAAFGKVVAEKVVPWLIDVGGTVIPMIVRAVGKVGEALPPIARAFLNVAAFAVEAWQQMYDDIMRMIGGLLAGLANTFGWVPGGIGDALKSASSSFNEFHQKSMTSLTNVGDGLRATAAEIDVWDKKAKAARTAELKVDIEDMQRDLKIAVAKLQDPTLTKERRAEITAEIAELERKIRKAKELTTDEELTKTRTAVFKAETSKAETNLRAIKNQLDDPNLTKDREAELLVAKAQAERDTERYRSMLDSPATVKDRTAHLKVDTRDVYRQVPAAQRTTNSYTGKTAYLRVDYSNVTYGTSTVRRYISNLPKQKTIPITVRWKTTYAGGWAQYAREHGIPTGGLTLDGPDDSGRHGLLAATKGRGAKGARFGQWGPYWSWNRRNGMGQHDGADISTGYGTPVYATRSGRVTFSGWSSARSWAGRHVIWRDSMGTQFIYAHLSSTLRSTGASTAKGTPLGRVGSTGNSTGAHLHIQASRSGRYVDPVAYLAHGGIVRATPGGVLAVLGEGKHDELVLPLDEKAKAGGLGGGELHVHFHSPVIGSEEDLARYVTEAQLRYRRTRGNVGLGLG